MTAPSLEKPALDKSMIEKWLLDSRCNIIHYFDLPKDWWPITQGDNQSKATAWANDFFLRALDALYPKESDLVIACNKGRVTRSEAAVFYAGYSNHSQSQIMLDFVAVRWDDAMPIKLTAESEMNAADSVGEPTTAKGYIWDFFKLLVVPCKYRLYMARASGVEKMKQVATCMRKLYQRHRGNLFSETDQFGGVVIPGAEKQRNETLILWTEGGVLQCEKISDFPLICED